MNHDGGKYGVGYCSWPSIAHDAAGNLTYDGVHAFTYDAWNRVRTVTKAYRAPGGAPGTGDIELAAVVSQSHYDAMGRRIVKAVQNSADLDGTYHYYYGSGGGAGGGSGGSHSLIEERDGSDNVLRQNVWGLMYIDELIQTSLNDDPEDVSEQAVESHYFALPVLLG